MFRNFVQVLTRQREFGRLGWIVRRDMKGVSFTSRRRMMEDFTHFINGVGNEASVYQIMKVCATGLVTEQPHKRVSLADQVYSTIGEKGIPRPVQLQNSLLQVYLSNRHHFSPSQFLQRMSEQGITPNRGTLTLLLEAYCQQGNMDGAREILSELKAKEMTINEEVYAALISGHAESGDMQSATALLHVMKDNGLEPGLTSYTALLAGHAYHGDLDAIKTTIGIMREQRLFAGHNVFADMLDALSRGGHHEKIVELLDMIRNKEWMYNELLEKAQIFASRGEAESSLHLLKSLAQLNLVGEGKAYLSRVGGVVFKHMIIAGKSLDFLFSSLTNLSVLGISPQNLFEELLRLQIQRKLWEDMKTTVLEMKKRDCVIKLHYIYPPLADFANKKDIEGFSIWLSLLLEDLKLEADSVVVEFALRVVDGDSKVLLKHLDEKGVQFTEGTIKALVNILCSQKQYDVLADLLPNFDKELIPVKHILVKFSRPQKGQYEVDIDSLLKIYTFLSPICDENDLFNSIHNAVSGIVHLSHPLDAVTLIANLFEKGIVPKRSGTYNYILLSLNKEDNTDEFFKFVRLMKQHGVPFDDHHHRQILKMSAKCGASLPAQTAFNVLKKKGDKVDSSTFSNLIVALCKAKKSHAAVRYYDEAEEIPDLHLSATAYSHLIQALIHSGNIAKATALKSKMKQDGLTPGYHIYNVFIEGYSKRGDVEKAKAEFDDMKSANITPSNYTYHKLMEGYAFHGDVTSVRELINDVKGHEMVVSKEMISALVDAYLNHEDLDGAIGVLEEEPSIRPILSVYIRLINRCEEQNRNDLTQQVLRSLESTEISPNTVHHIRIFALLRSGKFDEAMNIVRDENVHVNLDHVITFGKNCALVGNADCVRSAMRLLREIGLKAYTLHNSLLKAHARNNDIESMLSIRKELEACSEQPQQSFHTLLDRLLKQHSQEPPYIAAGTETGSTVHLNI